MAKKIQKATIAVKRRTRAGRPKNVVGAMELDKRVSFLEATLDLLSESDVNSITIREMGRACNMNTAMIYYYFNNKEGLVSAALEHALAQLIELYKTLEKSDSQPAASLDSWFEAHRIADDAMRKFLKITFNYSLSKDRMPKVDAMIRKMYQTETSLLTKSIDRCQESGLFSGINSADLAKFISIHLDGIFASASIRPGFDLKAALFDLRSLIWRLNQTPLPLKRKAS